ncbi:hypothetical protein PIROE2DRAFT_5477 [Piromyces sp. E2]|nr:hypothetical protein PIROE2DRAFT_5477 [Piromyces sp. E2]|eukprot:OUM67206.1 hypothetical protein PIROE2DRAFT_5477 [Piromyces sp. E2]
MDKEIKLNLVECTKEQCIKFAEMVLKDEFEVKELRNYFKNYGNDYTEEDAINIMKNIIIMQHHVNISNIEFLTYSSELLLKAAKCIKEEGSINYKILYGLCQSQFNERLTGFKDDATNEVIDEIRMRFYCLVNDEKIKAIYIKNTFRELAKKSERFHDYWC